MNTATGIPLKPKYVWTGTVGDLIDNNFDNCKTAFIGRCGTEEDKLFLINYNCVTQADRPESTWEGKGCTVAVIRFIDVTISIVERDEE